MLSDQISTGSTPSTKLQPLLISYVAGGIHATKVDVDSWELRAARRALTNLKSLLSPSQILELIEPQIQTGDAYYKSLISASNNQWRECRTDLHIKGISATQVQEARKKWLQQPREEMLKIILSIHPEHYAWPPYEGEGIVEVIGEHMARLRIKVTSDVPDFVMQYGDPEYPFKKPTVLELDDGTVFSYILHEFRNTDLGCDIILRTLFPSEAPEVFFKEHAEHFAIEFRAGVTAAYDDLHST